LNALAFLMSLACSGVGRAEQKLWFEPRAQVLPLAEPGPFVEFEDGSLLTIGNNCVITSKDDGKTWSPPRRIYDGPQPGIPSRGLLLGTRDGVIVLVYMDFSTQVSIVKGWDDDGLSWRTIGPSEIDASNAPGYVIRLASGRLALVWNRLSLEGKEPIRGSAGRDQLSHHERVDVSWQRLELSLAFSEDDGKTWTSPVVIVRASSGEVCYPYILERKPGQLWITTRNRANVRLGICEQDFVGK
jgi:hypothetical protein